MNNGNSHGGALILGVAAIMLVVGVALGSVVFPTTKTQIVTVTTTSSTSKTQTVTVTTTSSTSYTSYSESTSTSSTVPNTVNKLTVLNTVKFSIQSINSN